jgi:prepilin-type N-terminal cleavage/methylation domain-containing protein
MSRSKRLGFTAVEVMMSITILSVGAAGVIAMQKAAVQGNQDARDIDMANAIARQWMDRIQRDAMLWTPSDTGPTTNLSSAMIVNENFSGAWFLPSARLAPAGQQFDVESAGFDPLGRDLPSTAAQTEGTPGTTGLRFCTNLRLTPVITDPARAALIRAEVRVYWPAMLLSAPDPAFCNQVPPASLDTDTATYHFVYLVSAVRANVQP